MDEECIAVGDDTSLTGAGGVCLEVPPGGDCPDQGMKIEAIPTGFRDSPRIQDRFHK